MKKIFTEKGRKIQASANYQISLQCKETLCFLEKGSGIIFAIKKNRGILEGRRTMISSVFEGELLFNVMWEGKLDYEIVFFSQEPVVIWKIEENDFIEAIDLSEDLAKQFSVKIENWLNLFLGFMTNPSDQKMDYFLEQQGRNALDKGSFFSVKISEMQSEKKRILWLKINRGHIKLVGEHEFEFHDILPLFPHLRFQTLSDLDFEVKTTLSLINEKQWRSALAHFHHFLGRFLLSKQAKSDQDELKQFEKKELLQTITLHENLNKMISILNPTASRQSTQAIDPLCEALRLIGHQLDIEFQFSMLKNKAEGVKEYIEEIIEDSEARSREVELGPFWWKFDSGPLLCFYGNEKRPVALIQNKWGAYEIHDPILETKKRVTLKNARLIKPEAFSFYRTIHDQVKSGKKAFLSYFKVNAKEFLKLGACSLCAAIISLFPPIAIGLVFSQSIPNANKDLLLQISIGLLAVAFSSSIFIYFRSLLLGRVEGLASSQIQPALWDRLLKLPVKFFRKFSAGDLLLRAMAMEQVRPILSSDAARIMLNGIFSLFYLIVMAIYSLKLTLIAVALLSLATIITFFSSKRKVQLQKTVLGLQGKINGSLVQILSGISKLRVAGAENNAFSYWASLFTKMQHFSMKAQRTQVFLNTIMSAFPIFSFLVIFGAVIKMEEIGQLSIGAFIAFNSAFMAFSVALYDLNGTAIQVAPIIPIFRRSKAIIEEPQEILHKRAHPGVLTGHIQIHGVSFRYDDESPVVLKEISISVEPHKMVAIVGSSGSGKSTLIRLLLGFETPNSGAVYFNGKDLSHLNPKDVRKQIGVVLQEGGIIAGTLYQNIIAGGQYSREEIDRAIKMSCFDQDLKSFPMGLYTNVPMGGETLSGGQKQRFLIARALLSNPKILIFDEATSALDNKSQDQISSNIDALDMTRIVIAHRLSTIKNADSIYVMEGGVVVQTGTFATLSEQKGLFKEMVERQKL